MILKMKMNMKNQIMILKMKMKMKNQIMILKMKVINWMKTFKMKVIIMN